MLGETRLEKILKMVEVNGSVSIQELIDEIGTSESTIRRDLNSLHNSGQLIKVHGGAIAVSKGATSIDEEVAHRQELNRDDKVAIARYAVGLIENNDFIYLDAGTTTEIMADLIDDKTVTVVTNGISHAKKLAIKGIRVYLLGGMLKSSTEAVVGEEAVLSMSKYRFSKGFFGVNGITQEDGFTTPEVNEALLKRKAVERSNSVYVLADCSKFDCISSVKFGEFNEGTIITTNLRNQRYKKFKNILEV